MNSRTLTNSYSAKVQISLFYVDCAWNYKPGDIVQSEEGEIGYVVAIVSYDTLGIAWPTE